MQCQHLPKLSWQNNDNLYNAYLKFMKKQVLHAYFIKKTH